MTANKDIATLSRTMDILKRHNFQLKKNLGQNFLVDLNILHKILEAAKVSKQTQVIEIGPGIGALTEQLARRAKKVLAIEIDANLIPILNKTLAGYENIRIVEADAVKADLKALIHETFNLSEEIILVANLPYYITTPLLMKLMTEKLPIQRFCVMVQKEVAERITGRPGTKEYNALTILIQYFTMPRLAFVVPKSVFIPKPEVESAVLVFERRTEPLVEVRDEAFFFQVVKGSFIQRRKTLFNNLKQSLKGLVSTEDIQKGLEEAGIRSSLRGEQLTIEDFAKLSNQLLIYKKKE
ncbi:MAG TPA: 16S rRNA (adenine(1518)-N(6)/adenine(1519)-N(6))-dimethyltransferase RsmA [Haloplasmataceae bacterium]